MSTIPSPSPATGPVPPPARESDAVTLAQTAERAAHELLAQPAPHAPPAPHLAPPAPHAQPAPHLAPPAPHRLADVVPAPAQVQPASAGDWVLPAEAVIVASADPAALAVATQLAELLRPATGYPLPVTHPTAHPVPPGDAAARSLPPADAAARSLPHADAAGLGPAVDGAGLGPAADAAGPGPAGGIALVLDEAADLGAEGYRLDVARDGVRLTAATATGLFHGVQTLRQLLPPAIESPTPVTERWALPGGTITDTPRFPYRGAMLDVARHFFTVEDILRVVDHLARYKLNHLHLHLTDDQGWRIAVDSWPRLTSVGGATEVGGGPGGHYTKADYRRIVSYAAARHITVVPEIDLPGHTNSALVAYPELAPDKVAPPPYTGTEVGFSYVDPADERTYDFVTDVLGEVAALTPGPWLHIGGDEAFKVKGEVYTGFVERVQRIVAGVGKTVVGWHQLAPAGHVDGRVLQWWGTNADDPTTADAVRRGARLIVSPGNHAYLDMKYAPDTPIGHDWAGLIDVRKAYDWDPGTHVADVPATAVLGVEAPLWTESVTSLADIELLLLPRLPAIAELGWSPRATHDWADFRNRLAGQGPRWQRAGITFHRAPEVPWPNTPTIPTQRDTAHTDTTRIS